MLKFNFLIALVATVLSIQSFASADKYSEVSNGRPFKSYSIEVSGVKQVDVTLKYTYVSSDPCNKPDFEGELYKVEGKNQKDGDDELYIANVVVVGTMLGCKQAPTKMTAEKTYTINPSNRDGFIRANILIPLNYSVEITPVW